MGNKLINQIDMNFKEINYGKQIVSNEMIAVYENTKTSLKTQTVISLSQNKKYLSFKNDNLSIIVRIDEVILPFSFSFIFDKLICKDEEDKDVVIFAGSDYITVQYENSAFQFITEQATEIGIEITDE